MKKQPCSCEMHSKGFFPGLNIWSQYSIHICGDFSSLSSSEVLIMTCAHSFPAESVQEREITSADMACCCFTMHTDRCFQTQNTLAYLKNETHRHTWNTRHDTNTWIHRPVWKIKHTGMLYIKQQSPSPMATWPHYPDQLQSCVCLLAKIIKRCRASAITAWIINGYLLKNK